MKEELAISQGLGMIKNLNNSTEETAREEEDSNTDEDKSGLSKLVCDRYPNIVAGRAGRHELSYFFHFFL